MRRTHLLGAVGACALATFALPASAVTVDYSNTPAAAIVFDNTDDCVSAGDVGCFSFSTDINGDNIEITSGSASGALGTISGTFGVGTISSGGGLESASVNGSGTLTIVDATGGTLTGDLVWVDIFTFGVVGGTNVGGSANLSNTSYVGGTDPDLAAIGAAPSGIQTASFQFVIPTSLSNLFDGPLDEEPATLTETSFSGSITAVPIPPAVWLFGSGLLGLVGVARRRRT